MVIIKGDIKKINLSTSRFRQIIEDGSLYIDKTRMIEHFLNESNSVQLVARHRRLGKSLNMDMLRCFLTCKEDLRHLFKGLYIENSPTWEKAHSAPVYYFSFKELKAESYKKQVLKQVDAHICDLVDPDSLKGYLYRQYEQIMHDTNRASESIKFLMEMTYKLTGKNSYLLIDEYDNLLMANYKSAEYAEIRAFETALLSAAVKDNPYLEKALLTGVMRISHESMVSGLNNIVTYDVFGDDLYTDDYGLTDNEIESLCKLTNVNEDELGQWYNGIRVGAKIIYNIYSVMSYVSRGKFGCYWGKSGTMDMIVGLLNDKRKDTLVKLLSGEHVKVSMVDRISQTHLSQNTGDQSFYSFLVQAGYLALNDSVSSRADTAEVSIPNTELMMVWKNFILENLYINTPKIRTLFDNVNNLDMFSRDIEYFLNDRLSYHDLAVYQNANTVAIHERLYHIFLLGILSAYDDVRCKSPLSNRESGDGQYDILLERPESNYIFESKTTKNPKHLKQLSEMALKQIEDKRYGVEISGDKKLVKIGVAVCGKLCKVVCR